MSGPVGLLVGLLLLVTAVGVCTLVVSDLSLLPEVILVTDLLKLSLAARFIRQRGRVRLGGLLTLDEAEKRHAGIPGEKGGVPPSLP